MDNLKQLRDLIESDAHAMTFQSLGQYRRALVEHIDSIANKPAEDAVVEANRALLLSRSQVGLKKYGIALADATYHEAEVLQHAIEEALDLANYLQTLRMRLAQVKGIDRG